MTQNLMLRIDAARLAAVDELIPGRFKNRSEVLRKALDQFLRRAAAERDAEIYRLNPISTADLEEIDTEWDAADLSNLPW